MTNPPRAPPDADSAPRGGRGIPTIAAGMESPRSRTKPSGLILCKPLTIRPSDHMTTRQRILAHLKKTCTSTAREMARAMNLSAPNVRHHLGVLAADGRVTVVRARAEGRGRPEKVYSLSDVLEGDNLSALADALLTVERSTFNSQRLAEFILDSNQFTNLPIPRRLALLVEKLSEMHYQARWEAGAEGPRVIFGRCPYARIIEKHPELCQMDTSLLGNALGREVRQTVKMGRAQGVCVFSVR